MKILCLIDNLGSGGAQRQMVNLSLQWQKKGHQIDFVCYGSSDFYDKKLTSNGIKIERILCGNFLERIYHIRKYIRQSGAQIVVSFLETPNFLGCVSAIGKHDWVLITNERSANENSFRGLRSRIYKFFERYSDWTVCNSLNAQHMWERSCPEYKHRISTIYNAVIVPEIAYTKSEKSQRRIAVAASYQSNKNPINVIHALKGLSEADKRKISIDWYGSKKVSEGDTKIAGKVNSLVKQYHLEDCFHANDATQDIYFEMAKADAVGLFSRYEGLPNAVCEGMMIGKPIIMTHVSDYCKFITEYNGILCDADDVDSIRTALELFIRKSDDELIRMGEKSKEIANKLFNPVIVVEQWEELFNRLLSQKAKE